MAARWAIHRRTFLRGMGAAVALPVLDAMAPSLASVARGATGSPQGLPKRMAFIYAPNGVNMPHWMPKTVGPDFDLPRILEPLAAYKNDFSVLSGFAQRNGLALGDGAGDHARASAAFLTGTHARKTSGSDIRAGVSVDQIAAERVGGQTVLPSLELSCDIGKRVGACDSGYSCAYQFNIAWRSETMPVMPETEPRQVFERLFGDITGGLDSAAARSRRTALQKSILDFVRDDAQRLQSRLGQNDQRKLDEYLTAVREIEKRVELAEKASPPLPPGVQPPPEHADNFAQHVRLMFDMLALAFQTDSTRVSTFIISHEGSNRAYGEIGVNDGHHDLSHHFGDPKNLEKITKINTFHAEQFAYFLGKLKSVREGDGTLLDNCMIVYGSGLGDGNAHNHDNLPILLAGRGGGTITPGRHLKVSDDTPLNNVFLSLLDRMGSPIDRFGDSTSRFDAIA